LAAGDLLQPATLGRAVRACDAVLHAAAVIGPGGDATRFRDGNVVGTLNVVRAAAEARARLLHVSSTAVFGEARYRDEPTDESVPLPALPEWDAYGRSKQAAEALVLDAHRQGRIWATVVRPPVMYGLRDRQFVPRIGPVLERGFFPLVGGGRTTLNVVHADSVAEGSVRAVSRDEAGGRVYHLTNDFDLTAEDLVRGAEEGLGRRIRSPEVPVTLARAGFGILGLGLRVVGRSDLAPHARGTFRMLSRDNPFTSTRARAELGWSPEIRPSEGLPEAFRWWRERRDQARGGGVMDAPVGTRSFALLFRGAGHQGRPWTG
ncbi:MAG TPA: NAD-dependent epimerase/dehydratase family protein, partial [Longimicrobiales bacterium]|nr:NAD-dependent epimerase/dehydratase family protein [Longimicrobiales bacterium]